MTRLHAQGWRRNASWAEIAHSRIAASQSAVEGRSISLDDEVDDAVHEVALVGDVVVQRHRFDAELTGELAHRERFDPALIGEADGGVQHTLPAEGDAGL